MPILSGILTNMAELQAVDQWLGLLSSFVPNSCDTLPIALVANKCDKGKFVMPPEALDCFVQQHRLLCWQSTSAKQGATTAAAAVRATDSNVAMMSM